MYGFTASTLTANFTARNDVIVDTIFDAYICLTSAARRASALSQPALK